MPPGSTGGQAVEPLRVMFCANPGYFEHLAVAAASLAVAMPRRAIDIHVLTLRPDPAAEARLRASLAPFASVELQIHPIPLSRLDAALGAGRLPHECWLRYLAPEVLAFERVLYLDCDLVALRDLSALWSMDLRGRAVAAAPDFLWDRAGANGIHLRRFGHGDALPYYNSGVLLMDLAAWRAGGLTARLLDFGAAQGLALPFQDQDALNLVLGPAEVLALPPRWNLQARMYLLGRRQFPAEHAATRAARRDPAILHYASERKPWAFRSRCPGKGHYVRLRSRIAWPPAPVAEIALPRRAEQGVDRLIARLGGDYMVLADLVGALRRRLRPPMPLDTGRSRT